MSICGTDPRPTPPPASLKISADPPHREKYLPADPLDSSHDKSPPHIGFVVTLPSQEILRFLKKRQYAGLTPFFFGQFVTDLLWLRWSTPKGRLNALRRLGVGPRACGLAYSGLGAWRIARLWQMNQALSNKRLQQYGFILPWTFAEGAEKC